MMLPNNVYHLYNRGNNGQDIFYEKRNFLYFLKKARTHFLPHVDILAYCLMKNHFHFLINTKESFRQSGFSNDLMIMLRSYTRAINKQLGRTGSLFAQNTKIKLLETHGMTQSHAMSSTNADTYPFVCFHYIYQNPIRAGLVNRMEHWEMSSFQDYAGFRNGSLCHKELAYQLLDLPSNPIHFIRESYALLPDDIV
ncbi:transposase [Echinicola sediminis]